MGCGSAPAHGGAACVRSPHASGPAPPRDLQEAPVENNKADITGTLAAWREGDGEAPRRLFPLIYDELRKAVHRQLTRERPDHTLTTTALVHEVYLRLVDETRAEWVDRAHFLAVASRVMRHILVDYARRHQAEKRGGGGPRV